MERSTRMQLWKDMNGTLVEKAAELANTYDMPFSPSDDNKNKSGKEKAVINKTAETVTDDDVLKLAFQPNAADPHPGDNEHQMLTGENIKSQPQPKALRPTVDVTSKEPPKIVTQKTASHYALPAQSRYPLDSYNDVKLASVYFDEWYKHMTPELRHEYAVNMVKRAHDLDISVSDLAERYGAESYAPPSQIDMALDARRLVLPEEHHDLLSKVAGARGSLLPESFAALLGEFDRQLGLDAYYDGDVPDPYFSTFAKTAGPQEMAEDPKGSILVGNEYLTTRDLITFAKMGRTLMKDRFGEEFAEEFVKSPKAIFDSLPRDQKLVIMRLASAVDSKNMSSSVS
jgi:hypothetical protein